MGEYLVGTSQSGRVSVRTLAIVAATGCVLLLIWLLNYTGVVEVLSGSSQTGSHIIGEYGPDPALSHGDHKAFATMDQPDVVPFVDDTPALTDIQKADENGDSASYAAIALILSSASGDDSGLPSEDLLRQLDDETIEHLIETSLVERHERFTRLVKLQPEVNEGVVTALRVIPRSPPGVDLLLRVGLLQNDVIIRINGKGFPSITTPENLPGLFIVELLTAPSSRLGVLRGGSEILVIFEPAKLGSEGVLMTR